MDELTEEEINQLFKDLSDGWYCEHKMPCGLCDITKEKCEVEDE